MNIGQYLNLIPAIVVLILGICLFSRRGKYRHNIYLALSYIFFSLTMGGLIIYWRDSFRLIWMVDLIVLTCSLASSAAFYLYVADLTHIKGHKLQDHLIWIPAIFFFIANLVCYSIMNFQGCDYLYQVHVLGKLQEDAPTVYFYKRIFDSYLWKPVMFLQTNLIAIYTFFRIKKYKGIIDEYYSSVGEDIPQKFILVIAGLFLLIVVIGIYMSQNFSHSKLYIYSTSISGLVMTVLFTIMFSFARRSKYTILQLREMIAESQTREETDTNTGRIRKRVNEQIYEKFFLNPDVNLITFSETLNSNRTYVSNFIHEEYNCSFSDFVNKFRVEYAIKLMEGMPERDFTVKSIMVDSGFNSIQSFNRNFKKFEGLPPTEWMEKSLHSTRESQSRN